jgi:hypothetical protein
MGFFKNLGKSIKNVTKAVSLKNVVKVATGRGGEVVKEVVTRAVKPHVTTSSKASNVLSNPVVIGAVAAGDAASQRVESKLQQAVNKAVAGGSGQTNDLIGSAAVKFFSKAWFADMWARRKWWVIGIGAALVSLIAWLLLRGKKKKPAYRKRY